MESRRLNALDVARGCYARSPWWVRRSAGWALSALPLRLRLGKNYFATLSLIQRAEEDPEFVLSYQTHNLRRLLLAGRTIPHYERTVSDLLDSISIEELSIDDLRHLPILTKSNVRGCAERFLACDPSDVDLVTTGGTSGAPMEFYLDKDRGPKEWAFINHIWARGGYRPGDRRAVLRGTWIRDADTRPWEFDRALNELRLSPFHMTPDTLDEYLVLLGRFEVRFIHGYPSAISILARRALETGWLPPGSLAGVLPISETMYDFQRQLCRQAFGGARILPFYGLSEKVAIAGESSTSEGVYEFEPLYGITELVDDAGNEITQVGKHGRIVSTGLLSTGMPLIRYDTGDEGALVARPTRANGYKLTVSGIVSRWNQSYLVGMNHELISMAAMNVHSEAFASVGELQFHQDTPGEVTIRVVPRSDHRTDDLSEFVREIQRKVGGAVRFEAEVVDAIPTTVRGKRRLVDQRLRVKHSTTSAER